ncbi:MAG: hypothetical protein Q8P92_04225 [Candidatus Daviesbacteria bacterium]|nr:hypothetical protein [Candidatus Daviesbacteria bacterium]
MVEANNKEIPPVSTEKKEIPFYKFIAEIGIGDHIFIRDIYREGLTDVVIQKYKTASRNRRVVIASDADIQTIKKIAAELKSKRG